MELLVNIKFFRRKTCTSSSSPPLFLLVLFILSTLIFEHGQCDLRISEGNNNNNGQVEQTQNPGSGSEFSNKFYNARLSIRVISSLCGNLKLHNKTGELQGAIRNFPMDTMVINSCETILWRKCTSPGCISSFEILPCPTTTTTTTTSEDKVETSNSGQRILSRKKRVIGGSTAEQSAPGAAEFPWEVELRSIYNWGKGKGDYTVWSEDERAKNEIPGMGVWVKCSAVIYSRKVILTHAHCITPQATKMSDEYLYKTRFVLWVTRGKFLYMRILLPTNDRRHAHWKQTVDSFIIHPEFQDSKPEPAEVNWKGKGIGIIKLTEDLQEFGDEGEHKNIWAIEYPPAEMEFEGSEANFAGWGRSTSTREVPAGRSQWIFKGPTELQKIDLKIESATDCAATVKAYSEATVPTAWQKIFTEVAEGNGVFCATPKDPKSQSLCYGDEGGGLICTVEGKKYLCGMYISSLLYNRPNRNCLDEDNDKTRPLLFWKPGLSKAWIEEKAGPQDPNDLYKSK